MSTAEAVSGLPNETESNPQNPVEVIYLDPRSLVLSDMRSLLVSYAETGLDDYIAELARSGVWVYDHNPWASVKDADPHERDLGVGVHVKLHPSDPDPENGVRFEVFTPPEADDEVGEVVIICKRPGEEIETFTIKPTEDIGPQPPSQAIEALDTLDRELLRVGARR